MRRLCLLATTLAAATAGADPTPGHPVKLPTEYAAHRFYVTPRIAGGAQLRCYTDSGGGGSFVLADRLRLLKLAPKKQRVDGATLSTVTWPRFADDASIPPTTDPPFLVVQPRDDMPSDVDCVLGQSWFAGRVWTFDYPGKTLWWRAAGDLPGHERAHESALTFKLGADGTRDSALARIVVAVDGEELSLLFDTGAMVTPSAEARTALGDGGPAVRAGSFITTRTLEKWHRRHADWRVLARADEIGRARLRMIEVPALTVGGFTVGPVWFAERPDGNFDEFMSKYTDAHVEGALGGSALHYLRVTVDYPRATVVFEKP